MNLRILKDLRDLMISEVRDHTHLLMPHFPQILSRKATAILFLD